MPELAIEHDADAKCNITKGALLAQLGEVAFEHLEKICLFFSTVNATDEVKVGELLQTTHLPRMVVHARDTSHSLALVLKKALVGDAEIALVDELLVTGKDPPSLAKFISTSDRFAETIKQKQRDDAVAVLSHLGWAPQRFSSRALPYGRLALRLSQALETVSHEAEKGSSKRRAWAHRLLCELSGKNTLRLLLGAMLADLSHEHCNFVHAADVSDRSRIMIQLL